jgi:hypothetical protein
VFDIDGVLANGDHRQHHLEAASKDWGAFFAAMAEDTLVEEVARLTELLDPALCHVLLTARPENTKALTLEWLEQFELSWDLLVMRRDRDFQPSPESKRANVAELRTYGFDIRLAFDDDRRNVDMFHSEGIPCIYIHSGYYEL